jgi:translation initiation factor IF-1
MKMANKDLIELKGTIEELLPATTFKIKLESGQIVLGHLSGKLRMNKIRLSLGDSVKVEMTPYDLTKGRITYRF